MTTATAIVHKQTYVGHGSMEHVFKVVQGKINDIFMEDSGLLCLDYEEGNVLFQVKRLSDDRPLGTVRVTYRQLANDKWRMTERHAVTIVAEVA